MPRSNPIPAKRPDPAPDERQLLAARVEELAHRIAIAAGILRAGEPDRQADARQRIKAYADELDDLVLLLKGNLEAEELCAQGEVAEASA